MKIDKLKDTLPIVRQAFARYAKSLLSIFKRRVFTDRELASLVRKIRELHTIQAFVNGKVGNAF